MFEQCMLEMKVNFDHYQDYLKLKSDLEQQMHSLKLELSLQQT